MAGQRKALIIASDTYEQEALQNLRAPAADAAVLGRVLGDPQIADFAVQVVHNQPAHVISAQIEEMFSDSRPDDVLLLHFSGHGLKSESGELFFAAANTRPNRLGSTAVSADFVQRCMREARSRSVVLLLDCCYGGAFAQGVKVRAAGDIHVLDSFPRDGAGGGRGRAVITASSAMEFAFEGEQLGEDQPRRPSVFTTALVEGLETGDADRDQDGWISLDELYDYLFDKVREQNPHQTPSRQFELEGELYLARSRRRRVQPIPADLQAALADPNIYARLGAVSELRSRLVGDNLPAAEGACDALRHLSNSDVSFVARAAAEALAEAAVRPAPRELHFGRVEQGSPSPHRTVRLAGPPLARACPPRPSHDWIRVAQAASGLDVSVDTARAGTLRGSIALKGPAGEAVIAVDVDLVTPAPAAPALAPAPAPAPAPIWPEARPAAAPPGARAPVVTRTAFAGLWVSILAGATGIAANQFLYSTPYSGAPLLTEQAQFALPMAAAVAAITLRNQRRVLLGLLQGLWWPSAAWLTWYIAAGSQVGGTAYYADAAAHALGILAAVLLLVAWHPGTGRSRTRGERILRVTMASCIILSQIVGLYVFTALADDGFAPGPSAFRAEGVALLIVGLACGWAAARLADRAFAGALALGWAVITAIALNSTLLRANAEPPPGFNGASITAVPFEVLLLVPAAILAVVCLWRSRSS